MEIELEAHAAKGIGKTYAKWSPVALAWYRMLSEVILLKDIGDPLAEELVATCPVKINYAPVTTYDWMINRQFSIGGMFPFLEGTRFERGIDAAFESSEKYEAYLFKDDMYALINYNSGHLIRLQPITDGFHSLENTIFASGFDAAFASHKTNEAYLFKGDSYTLINFAPGTTNDYIIGGFKPILPNWSSLRSVLPRKNVGFDSHNHSLPQKYRLEDE
ncbi:hypothetical protein M0R45_017801 [Rubus argutus]|uniref:Hemopexin-like domain-containing protein n=1 Tax=Rubus argutus TaxID=59490 RepID=A0AAW1XX71_RUBAR